MILALGMGVTKIFGVARDKKLLERLLAIAPSRIHVMSAGDRPIDEWVREHTDGLGADIFIDAVGQRGMPGETVGPGPQH